MKKIWTVGIMLTMTGAAHAQTSITLYGLLDTAISYQTHQVAATNAAGRATSSGSVLGVAPGFFNGSRWGILGSEDLGGGLSAVFRLESGFAPDTGLSLQGARLFGRQAFVGLNGEYGQITLGRQYSVPFDVLLPFDTIGWGNTPASDVWVQLLAGSRLDNSVKYAQQIGPLKLTAAYSAGELAGSVANGSTFAAGVGYASGKFATGIVGQQAKDPAGHKQTNSGVGASYVIGPVTLHGYYLFARRDGAFAPSGGQDFAPTYGTFAQAYANPGLTNVGASTTARTDHVFQFGTTYQVTSALQVKAAAIYDTARHVSAAGENGYKLSAFLIGDYFFSKRTDVYLAGTYNKVSASLNAPYGGHSDSIGALLGMRHRF
ncbi:Outer membrane protein (porin) [Cupriavidus sp. YR651]|uniref:porin n=1 Tax=Cupriavidus sp. YR651 TaxID=1855315 RepID=UPI00088AF847|nr:porin [Cupriavidus sp. YR651]SDC97294.1 Outer membrane protein (porin) [Cupriavidus sp. YR651]